jgi:hypothetical protein
MFAILGVSINDMLGVTQLGQQLSIFPLSMKTRKYSDNLRFINIRWIEDV